MNTSQIPGLSLGIIKNGQLVYLKGYGLADVANQIPATECTMYRLASASKMFTGIAALQLYEQGIFKGSQFAPTRLISDVQTFVPEFTNAINPQIGDLISHRAGFPGSDGDRNTNYINAHITHNAVAYAEILSAITLNPPGPGASGTYSNKSFDLAAAVIERASGLPYELYVKNNIFDVAHMPMIQPEYSWRSPYPEEAEGYQRSGSQGTTNPETNNADPGIYLHHLASGGFVCTVTDLALFAKSFINNDFFSNPGTRSIMLSNRGTAATLPYGYGIRLDNANPNQPQAIFPFHNGDIAKSSTMVYFDPTLNHAVVFMLNITAYTQGNMLPIAQQLMAMVPGLTVSGALPYFTDNEPAVENVNLTGFENGTRVHVARNITNNSTYSLLANANVKLDGEQIILKQGFSVNPGATFIAHLGNIHNGCSSQGPTTKWGDDEPDKYDHSSDTEFRIYPNPTRGETTVQYRVAENTPVKIRLMDYTGRVVKVLVDETVTDEALHVVKVNGDHLAPGIYQVIMQKPDGSKALRMIVAD